MHDQQKLKTFSVWSYADKAVMRKPVNGRRRPGLHPSSASVIAREGSLVYAIGGCHRAEVWKLLGIPETNPHSITSAYTFKFGNYIEDMIRKLLIESGTYEASSIKFYYPKYRISGEIDLWLNHPQGGQVIVEVKSTYGYYSDKALKDGPKDDNLLQLITYLYVDQDDPGLFAPKDDIVGGKLIYLLRDNFHRYEFNVTLEEDGNIVVNENVEQRFKVGDIMNRYEVLLNHVTNINDAMNDMTDNDRRDPRYDENLPIPPRDYALYYRDDEIDLRAEHGHISKSAYDKFKKSRKGLNVRPGHWRCSWCSYKDKCWPKEEVESYLEV